MAFLILDIETVPCPSIDEAVEEAVIKKWNPISIEPVIIQKILNHLFIDLTLFRSGDMYWYALTPE